ncbi:MAG: tRNA 2-thiouridine(34) synthase MnmA [Desulfomonilaceae bacterium]
MNIAVALSGGIDSACSALLLKKAGYDVIGLHMKLMPGRELDSWSKAKSVASCIDIPLHLVDLTTSFQKLIVDYFVSEYAAGRTPSPCPRCNQKIKMTLLLEHALALGADRLATGHYARILNRADGFHLLKGVDSSKDQSYFLFMLSQDILSNMCFPLGELTKSDVRNIVKEYDLPVIFSQESQELCFIPNAMYTDFLVEHGVQAKQGVIVDTNGRAVGKHKGVIFYTVGQRRGLGVCGPEPYYVVEIDPVGNEIVIGNKNETLVSGILINQLNFISGSYLPKKTKFSIKVRSTSKEIRCTVEKINRSDVKIHFEKPQSGVAPGQAAVIYDGEEVIGGGWIQQSLRY